MSSGGEVLAIEMQPLPPVFGPGEHVHLNNLDMQLALMNEFGVERAVIFWGRLSDDEAITAAAQKHPGRFVPFASISPERTAFRPQWERDDPAIRQGGDDFTADSISSSLEEREGEGALEDGAEVARRDVADRTIGSRITDEL